MSLILNSFSKVVKSRLNSDPLSNKTLRGCGYLNSHVLLTLADDLSMNSLLPDVTSSRLNFRILTILNQTVAGSIIIVQVIISLFRMIVLSGCCCIIDLLYEPIRSTCTEYNGFSSEIFLGGKCS